MVDKVQKDLEALVLEMKTDHWEGSVGFLSFFTKPKNQDDKFALRVTQLVEEHGNKILNTPLNNGQTLLDIVQSIKESFELITPFKEKGTRFPQTARVIIEKGGMTSKEISPPQKATGRIFNKDIKQLANELQIDACIPSTTNPIASMSKVAENKLSGPMDYKINSFIQKYGPDALNEIIPGTKYTLLDVAQDSSKLATLEYAREQMQGIKCSTETINLLVEKGAKTSAELQVAAKDQTDAIAQIAFNNPKPEISFTEALKNKSAQQPAGVQVGG